MKNPLKTAAISGILTIVLSIICTFIVFFLLLIFHNPYVFYAIFLVIPFTVLFYYGYVILGKKYHNKLIFYTSWYYIIITLLGFIAMILVLQIMIFPNLSKTIIEQKNTIDSTEKNEDTSTIIVKDDDIINQISNSGELFLDKCLNASGHLYNYYTPSSLSKNIGSSAILCSLPDGKICLPQNIQNGSCGPEKTTENIKDVKVFENEEDFSKFYYENYGIGKTLNNYRSNQKPSNIWINAIILIITTLPMILLGLGLLRLSKINFKHAKTAGISTMVYGCTSASYMIINTFFLQYSTTPTMIMPLINLMVMGAMAISGIIMLVSQISLLFEASKEYKQ